MNGVIFEVFALKFVNNWFEHPLGIFFQVVYMVIGLGICFFGWKIGEIGDVTRLTWGAAITGVSEV